MDDVKSTIENSVSTVEGLFFGGSGGGFSAPSGVKGPDTSAEYALIAMDAKLAVADKKEKAILYFRNKGPRNAILLTNLRFVKVEDGSITAEVYHENVTGVHHEKNGAFRWDKVCCTLKDGKKETFGIFESKVAAFFVDTLQRRVKHNAK